MKFNVKKKYIIYAVIIIVVLALALAYLRSGTDMCTVSLEACMLKAKTHGFFGKIFLSVGCIFKNLWCVVTSLF